MEIKRLVKDPTGIPLTCPLINDIKDKMRQVRHFLSTYNNKKFAEPYSKLLLECSEELEEIRKDNESLREKALKAATEIFQLETNIEYLKEENDFLQDRIKNSI